MSILIYVVCPDHSLAALRVIVTSKFVAVKRSAVVKQENNVVYDLANAEGEKWQSSCKCRSRKLIYGARMKVSAYLLPTLHAQDYELGANGFDFQVRAGAHIPHITALPAFPFSRASPLPPTDSPTPLRYFSLSPIFFPAFSQRCLISLLLSSAKVFSAGQ